MSIELKMPALSPTMEEGTLAKWLVKEGDTVSSGDILAEIETDKATMEFEAVDEGTIAQILVPEGTDDVKVGTVIALIAGEGESAKDLAGAGGGPKHDAVPAKSEKPAPVEVPADQKAETDEIQKPMPTAARDLVASADRGPEGPEVPEGTEMVRTTVREALRDAM